MIKGNGSAPPPNSVDDEAENAVLGSASAVYCELCSGASKAGNIGGCGNGTVTFTNVNVPRSGTYQVEIDYVESVHSL